jgi:hypothetical protein
MQEMFRLRAEAVPKTAESGKVAYFLASMILVFLLAQLFSFEDMAGIFETFGLPGGLAVATIGVWVLVVSELLALPFLLNMALPKLLRIVSMVGVWIATGMWALISLWLMISDRYVDNVGLVGSVFDLASGWWALFFAIGLCILAFWASWGLWRGVVDGKTVSSGAGKGE